MKNLYENIKVAKKIVGDVVNNREEYYAHDAVRRFCKSINPHIDIFKYKCIYAVMYAGIHPEYEKDGEMFYMPATVNCCEAFKDPHFKRAMKTWIKKYA